MKRILIATVALMGFVAYSFGQGEVVFGNGITATRIWTTTLVNGQQANLVNVSNLPGAAPIIGSPAGTGHEWAFALFSANVGVGTILGNTAWTDPAWVFTGAYASNSLTTTGGRLFGQQNADGSVTVPGHVGGASANLTVVGWNTASAGTTLAEFISAYDSRANGLVWGYSGVATKVLGDGGAIPATSFMGTTAGLIPGFVLAPIPEPTTFALAGLGAAALMIFRRRK